MGAKIIRIFNTKTLRFDGGIPYQWKERQAKRANELFNSYSIYLK